MAFTRIAPPPTPDIPGRRENSRNFHGGDTRTIASRPHHRGDEAGWGGNGPNNDPNSGPNIRGGHHRGGGTNCGGGIGLNWKPKMYEDTGGGDVLGVVKHEVVLEETPHLGGPKL